MLPIDAMLIDVGASSRADVEAHYGIKIGDPIVPLSEFTQMHEPHLING